MGLQLLPRLSPGQTRDFTKNRVPLLPCWSLSCLHMPVEQVSKSSLSNFSARWSQANQAGLSTICEVESQSHSRGTARFWTACEAGSSGASACYVSFDVRNLCLGSQMCECLMQGWISQPRNAERRGCTHAAENPGDCWQAATWIGFRSWGGDEILGTPAGKSSKIVQGWGWIGRASKGTCP